jgi:multiple sugar transport system permease protein
MSVVNRIAAKWQSSRVHITRRTRNTLWGYFFLLPFLVSTLVFWVIPLFQSAYYSFTRYTVLSAPRWVGLRNYVKLVTDDRLLGTSVFNTLYYTAFSLPLGLLIALVLALLLNTRIPGMTVFRSVLYLPSVIPMVATAALWTFLLTPRIGLVNIVLTAVRLNPPNWLTEPEWAKPALILMNLWTAGGSMVVYLAGLQGIPESLYESAQIDGANCVQQLFRITIPMMTPTIFYNLIMGLISSMQVFSTAYIMTGGGPLNATYFYMLKLYQHAFFDYRMGYASAMAWLLFVVVLGLTVLVFKTSDRWVFYAAGE